MIGIKTIAALEAVKQNASKRTNRIPVAGTLRDPGDGRAIPKSFLESLHHGLLLVHASADGFCAGNPATDPYKVSRIGEMVLAAFKLGKRYA